MEKLAQKFSAYQEFYTKGDYLFFQKSKITIQFSGNFFRFESFQDVFNENLSSPLFELVGADYLGQPDMTLSHEFDRNLKSDSFYFTVSKRNHITIKTKNLRGFRYASEVLSLVIEKTTNGTACLIVSLAHEPSFQVRGIIEGFYGTPWKQSDRLDVLHYLGNNRMNTYMYAPKDDLYQRTLWRTLYPDSELAKFEQLVQTAEEEMIDFYYMISPGNDIDYTQVKDIRVLTSKLKQLIDSGIRHFGLLLDDIDYSLKGNAKKKFSSAASAHAYLITQVDTFLRNELEDYSLVVCPTEYDNSHDSAYLEILSAKMPIGIPLFWTGPSTLASQITTADIRKMAHIYNRPMIIWDNIPVNDYQKDYELLFLSPYENRSPLLSQEKYHVLGIVSNPMPQWELSKLTIQTMSQFLWDSSSYKLADSWNKTLAAYLPTDYLSALKLFTAFNPSKYTRAVLTFEQKQAIWNKDIPFITVQLEQLLTASRKLAEVKNDDFQSTIGPWLKRVEQDLTYWDSIKKGTKEEIKKVQLDLNKSQARLGTDLPAEFVNYWNLIDETIVLEKNE